MNLHDRDERSVEVVRFGLLGVENLDGVSASGNSEDGTAEEVFGELFSVEGGGGDDELKIGSTLEGFCSARKLSGAITSARGEFLLTLEQAEEDISGDRALVSLVEHEHRILRHVGIDEALSLQHTVRHVLDLGLGTCAVLESNGVADLLTETTPDLLGDALGDGHGGDATRLSAANLKLISEAGFGEVLRHLRRLA